MGGPFHKKESLTPFPIRAIFRTQEAQTQCTGQVEGGPKVASPPCSFLHLPERSLGDRDRGKQFLFQVRAWPPNHDHTRGQGEGKETDWQLVSK